jgi:hypothetical protein
MEVTERDVWIARGFTPVAYIELICTCGTFRTASPEPLRNYPCPECHQTLPARIIAEGATKRHTIAWERIAKPYRFGRAYPIQGSQKSALVET